LTFTFLLFAFFERFVQNPKLRHPAQRNLLFEQRDDGEAAPVVEKLKRNMSREPARQADFL
jgi:hypothetical protein